jgi:hypothetical protein
VKYYEPVSGYGTTNTSIASLVTSVAGVFGGVVDAPGESGMIYICVNTSVGAFGTEETKAMQGLQHILIHTV